MAASEANRPDKLPHPGSAAKVEAETEFATQGTGAMEEETLFVAEMPTSANGHEERYDEECELDDRASTAESATRDETRSNTQIFEDAAPHQILDDDNSFVDSIRAEKQERWQNALFHSRDGCRMILTP